MTLRETILCAALLDASHSKPDGKGKVSLVDLAGNELDRCKATLSFLLYIALPYIF